jgi:alpha-galactosidase
MPDSRSGHHRAVPVVHLRAGGVSLVLDCTGGTLPRVLHWGADLGPLEAGTLTALAAADRPQHTGSTPDEPVPLALLPEASAGWPGTPGLTGHRDGTHFTTAFTVRGLDHTDRHLRVDAEDPQARLALRLEAELTDAGLLRMRATLTDTCEGTLPPYTVDGLLLALPVPDRATELLDLTGRHLRERSPQRHAFTLGTHLREARRGRTGLGATLLHAAGEAGFGFRSGEVWAVHTAWSGNHRTLAERTPEGASLLAGGESLLPGEVRLHAGESYTTPWLYASHGRGLDALAARFHHALRARPHHPRGPRPVTLNTWEAVYFRHDAGTLRALADHAAAIGVERFVLDDGWFRGRRDDHAGLGDWYVDEEVWPDGLRPLADHVRGLGMEFGLWVEPEMVNPDSDLARAHPDWILAAGTRMPPEARHQQVLNVAHPDAYAYLAGRLDALVTENRVGYLKWDHNRDLVDAGTGPDVRAGVHAQTLAVYRLMAELRARHPGLEIESCSSGGGRADLGVLEHTDRVWTSDCIDALERQSIQRWTGLLLPPELLGAHVGAPTAHTTGRTHGLAFRAGTALFGHFGIEWDLSAATEDDRAALAAWIAAYKDLRPLLHTGEVVHGDHHDPALWVHGVVAPDKSRAVYALVQTATGVQSPPGRVRLPGLDDDADYDVVPLAPGDDCAGPVPGPPHWWHEGVRLPGRVLAAVGLQAPVQYPEHLVLLEARRNQTAEGTTS